MSKKTSHLIDECKRQSESCLYSSTALFIWLRWLRCIRVTYILAAAVLGSIASSKILLNTDATAHKGTIALLAFLAGILPAAYSSLKLDSFLEQCSSLV